MRAAPLALLALLFASCHQAPPEAASPFDNDQVLATVGTETITKADLEAARARRPIAPAALLDELIEHRALVQEARARGYDRDPQTIANFENALANRVREENRQAQISEVTPAEIEARYRADKKKFTLPAKIRAAMIFVEAPATFTEEKRAERRAALEAARAKALAAPKEFAALAAEYSYDQTTKLRGGDPGWLVENIGAEELEPPVFAAAFALKQPRRPQRNHPHHQRSLPSRTHRSHRSQHAPALRRHHPNPRRPPAREAAAFRETTDRRHHHRAQNRNPPRPPAFRSARRHRQIRTAHNPNRKIRSSRKEESKRTEPLHRLKAASIDVPTVATARCFLRTVVPQEPERPLEMTKAAAIYTTKQQECGEREMKRGR